MPGAAARGAPLVMTGATVEITTLWVDEAGESALPWLLLACTAKAKGPAAVGVPLNRPVVVFRERPGGSGLGLGLTRA